MMFVVELFGKIIYLSNKLFLEKLLLETFGKYLHSWIFRAFILKCCVKDLES